MRNLQTLFIISLFLVSLNFVKCSKETDEVIIPVPEINIDTLNFSHSMKGWELYSWPNGNDWNYSIAIGTNRIKSYHEVTNQIVVYGKDSLKLLLNKLPENEEVCWIGSGWLERCWGAGYNDLCLPDKKTVNEIKEYCSQINLQLAVAD